MNYKITRRIWTLSAIAVAGIAGLCAATAVQVRDAAEAAFWVDHTQEVIAEANSALAQMSEAETSQRGYLLTHDPAYVAHYDELAGRQGALLDGLKRLTADNSLQQHQLATLDGVVRDKFERMSQTMALARDGRMDEALERVRSATNGQLMERVRQGFASVVTVEHTLLQQRKARADEISRRLELGMGLGGALAAALVLVACVRVAGRLRAAFRDLLQGIAVLGQGNLEHRIAVDGDDEIGRIATAFNTMAGQLAAERRVRDHAEEELQQMNAQLLSRGAELEQRNSAIDLLGKMAHRLQAALSEEEFGQVVACFVPQILPTTPGALYLLNNSRNLLVRAAQWLNPRAEREVFTPEDCWGLRRGQPHLVVGAASDVNCPHVEGRSDGSYMCLPLLAQGDIVGLLYLESDHVPGAGATGGYDYTAVLAENIALALVNHRLRETLKEQSIRDPLTGLFNRRYLEATAELEFARAARASAPIGVLMVDVDHFKRFNDTFGHDAGDLLLKAVGAALQEHVRGGDVVCRFGGEEFTVLLPGATLEQAVERAEVLREAIRAISLSHDGRSLGTITASAGAAAFPVHGGSLSAVMAAADAALYKAKQAGRDRVLAAAQA